MHSGLLPGQKVPLLQVPLIGGDSFDLYKERPTAFNLVLFYRGLHCPLCKKQMAELADRLPAFRDLGVDVVAISMDNGERAQKTAERWETGEVRVGFNLTAQDANRWGLFISERAKDEEPLYFTEPGLFLVTPDYTLYAQYLQTVPFARPRWDDLLDGLKFIQKNDYPIRGKASTNMEARA